MLRDVPQHVHYLRPNHRGNTKNFEIMQAIQQGCSNIIKQLQFPVSWKSRITGNQCVTGQ